MRSQFPRTYKTNRATAARASRLNLAGMGGRKARKNSASISCINNAFGWPASAAIKVAAGTAVPNTRVR